MSGVVLVLVVVRKAPDYNYKGFEMLWMSISHIRGKIRWYFKPLVKLYIISPKSLSQCNWRFLSLKISVLELTILNLSIGTGNLHSSCTEGVNLANAALQAMACFRLQQRAKGISTWVVLGDWTEKYHGLTMSYLQLTYFKTVKSFTRDIIFTI